MQTSDLIKEQYEDCVAIDESISVLAKVTEQTFVRWLSSSGITATKQEDCNEGEMGPKNVYQCEPVVHQLLDCSLTC